MDPKRIDARPIPSSAVFWFALSQAEHAAALAACAYFARKLRNPHERAIAQSAVQALSTPRHWSLPSEDAAHADEAVPAPAREEPSPARKGLSALRKGNTTR
jgi:hypothetical protein